MKKILMVGPFPGQVNGMTIANQTLFDGLSEKYKVNRINTLKNDSFTDKKLQGKFNLKKFLSIVLELKKEISLIKNNDFDVIYMTTGQSYLGFMRFAPYMLISIKKRVPLYIHIHGGYFRKMYDSQSKFKKKTIDYFLKRIDGAIVLGDSLRNMFKGLVSEEKIYVCENGVQDEFIVTEEEIQEKIKRAEKDNKKRVLYLSNLMEEKGILDLLKASESFSEDEIEFNLAGAIEPSIKEKIEEYLTKYPNKIKYHGIVKGEEKKRLLLDNYIFILPSRDEGQPLSILEAYANGCAVITDPTVGGIRDIFTDEINGMRCIIKDISNIQNILENNSFQKYFEMNYKIVKKKFLRDFFINRIEKIIIWRKDDRQEFS